MRKGEYWSLVVGSSHKWAHLWRPAAGNCDISRCGLGALPSRMDKWEGHEKCKRCEESERKDVVSE